MVKSVMKGLTEIQSERLKTAWELLAEKTTSLDKIQKISALIKGINPKIDKQLETISKIAGKIQKVQSGDVINLSLEQLPEKSEKEKKRKKLLLLLIARFRDLQSEVGRINEVVLETAQTTKVVKSGKIVTTMKGPLGMVTIAAAGIVAISSLLNSKAVNVTIKNEGCRPIQPVIEKTINLPGLKLPSSAITSGSQDMAVIPGIKFKLDATEGKEVDLSAMGISRSYGLPGEIVDIVYDGQSLLGKSTEINLGSAKTHEVVVRCGK
jgi:hypothetical protein